MSEEYIVDVDHVTIRFNLASEKVDNLKEYVIRLLKHQLMFQEFLAVKDVSLKIRPGEAWGAHRYQRFRKIHAFEGDQWYYEAV